MTARGPQNSRDGTAVRYRLTGSHLATPLLSTLPLEDFHARSPAALRFAEPRPFLASDAADAAIPFSSLLFSSLLFSSLLFATLRRPTRFATAATFASLHLPVHPPPAASFLLESSFRALL